ncbi:MAG: hypothetical protein MUD13_01610 [Candidatus Nanopelagicales bacterium]|jgi:hypothetical protein|nr:hypothetical protein [Candidatus Nanopelagicales bacterium]
MQRVEVVVDGVAIETWAADEAAASEVRIRVLEAAEAGATIRLDVLRAQGEELLADGTLVLRMGNVSTVVVRVLPDDRTGAAMGISR